MISLTRLFGLTLLVAIAVADPRLREVRVYFDIPAAVFITVATLSYMLIRCEFSAWSAALRVVCYRGDSNDSRTLRSAYDWFQAAIHGGLAAGCIGFLINFIGVLMDSYAPIENHIGGTAVSLLYLLYAAVPTLFILYPLASTIRRRLPEQEQQEEQ